MTYSSQQATAPTRSVSRSEPSQHFGGPSRPPESSSSRLRLSEQEREFVAVGLHYANPFLSAVWPMAYSISPLAAWLANRGLLTLESKIIQRLRTEVDEDEESDLINDLHSIQLTRKRIQPAVYHPFRR
jgi:hypothetical protein